MEITDKILAVQAILWILATVYFTFKAVSGNYPVWFGIATSTFTIGLGSILAFLLIVVIK